MTKDDKVRFTFRLPDALYIQIGRKAEELGVSRNALILQILWDWDKPNRPTALPSNNQSG